MTASIIPTTPSGDTKEPLNTQNGAGSHYNIISVPLSSSVHPPYEFNDPISIFLKSPPASTATVCANGDSENIDSHSLASSPALDVAPGTLPECGEDYILGPLDIVWTDPEEIAQHIDVLAPLQQRLFSILERKRVYYGEGLSNQYFDNGYLITGLAGEDLSQRYVYCGRPDDNRTVYCNKPLFCPRCASYKTSTARRMYSPAFRKGTFHFLTASFDGDLPYEHNTAHHLPHYWRAINESIKSMCKGFEWDGAYWVDEVAINSFCPTRIIPHAHAIIHSDEVSDADIELLCELITGYSGDDEEEEFSLALEPSITCEALTSQESFDRTVGYLTKAMNLSTPYTSASIGLITPDRLGLQQLNREAREIIEGLPVVTRGMYRVNRAGSMSPNCTTSFIGVPKLERTCEE